MNYLPTHASKTSGSQPRLSTGVSWGARLNPQVQAALEPLRVGQGISSHKSYPAASTRQPILRRTPSKGRLLFGDHIAASMSRSQRRVGRGRRNISAHRFYRLHIFIEPHWSFSSIRTVVMHPNRIAAHICGTRTPPTMRLSASHMSSLFMFVIIIGNKSHHPFFTDGAKGRPKAL